MISAIDKARLFSQLQAQVDAELQQLLRAQQTTQAGATHEESRPENDKDTRALESTYLARGLAERVVKLEKEATALRTLQPRTFGQDDHVALSALVQVEFEDSDAVFLLSPAGAGLRLAAEETSIQVLTPHSPVGQALIGKYCDEEIEYDSPQGRRTGTIVALR